MKITPIRLEVLRVLQEKGEPAGIQDIHEVLRSSGVNYVSVYRTLLRFADAGVIRPINLRHGHADYEFVGTEDHHHIVCTGCGKVEEFEDCDMKGLMNKALKTSVSFQVITDHALEFFGKCKKCTGG